MQKHQRSPLDIFVSLHSGPGPPFRSTAVGPQCRRSTPPPRARLAPLTYFGFVVPACFLAPSLQQVNPAEVRDPRGSFFAESEHTPGGVNTEQPQPPPSAGYSFDPLPQRQKRARARATTASVSSSLHDSDGTPAKRRGVDRGVAGGPERAASPGVVVARNNNDKVKVRRSLVMRAANVTQL